MTEPAAEKIMQRVDDVDSKKIPADVGRVLSPACRSALRHS
jgi:hypothetical protein